MPGSQPGPAAQAAADTEGTVYVNPVTDMGNYDLPAGSPGALMLAGPRAQLTRAQAVQTRRLIAVPPPPGVPGRLVRNADGTMGVTAYSLPKAATASLSVTQHPLNLDPPPGVPIIQQNTDGSVTVFPLAHFSYGITSQAGDEGQVNSALLQALPQGRPVLLAPEPFLTQGPVAMPGSAAGAGVLRGSIPVGEAAGTAGAGIFGSIIRPQGQWSGGPLSNAGAVHLGEPGLLSVPVVTDTTLFGPVVENLWIDLRNAAAGTHGLSMIGSVNHAVIRGIGIWGNVTDRTSDCMHLDVDPSDTQGVNYPDGAVFDTIITQEHGRYGIYCNLNDSVFDKVHVQAAPNSTTDSGCWFMQKANNCRLIACRADQGLYGWIFDSDPGGNPDTPGAPIAMVGCGSENAYHSALFLLNSSGNGQKMRVPVQMTGGDLDFAGRDGASPAVLVQGFNFLTMSNVNVSTGGHGFPVVGLQTAPIGTGPGVPAFVEVKGGIWNINGTNINQMFEDNAPATVSTFDFWGYALGDMVSPVTLVQFKSAGA